MSLSWMDLAILAFATWRLASLVAAEEGPYKVLKRLREWMRVRYREVAKGMSCVWCNSVWIAVLLFALYALWQPVVYVLAPLALSAGAILVEEAMHSG